MPPSTDTPTSASPPSPTTVVSISLPRNLLQQIDERAEALGLPRSTYVALLARQDLKLLGHNILRGPAAEPETQVELTAEARDFLYAAIPQLVHLDRQQRRREPSSNLPEPDAQVTTTALWQVFELERQSILENKWYLSQRAGHDVGVEAAIRDWLKNYASAWTNNHPVPGAPPSAG